MNRWRSPRARGALAVAAALLLGACAADMPRDVKFPERVSYKCENGRMFVVEFAPSGETAMLTLDGRGYRLAKVPSATQAKYSDGRVTLWLDGETALAEVGVTSVGRACKSEQPLAEGAREQRPLFGKDPWWR